MLAGAAADQGDRIPGRGCLPDVAGKALGRPVIRESGEQALYFLQAAVEAGVPNTLLPRAEQSDVSSLRVSGNAATLATVRLADGGRWRELAWSDGDTRYVIRYRGHDADVLRMARSLRKERP